MSVSVCHMCECGWGSEEGVRFPCISSLQGLWALDCGWWELNSGSGSAWVFLIAEPISSPSVLLFSFSISFLLFRNTINICVLILHPAAWFNLPSVFCFVDCNSKASYVDVHHADNNMASIGNEECKDLYGTVFWVRSKSH